MTDEPTTEIATDTEEPDDQAPVFSNPLNSLMTSRITHWEQLLELWNSLDSVELRLGLLHQGFEIPYWSPDDNFGTRVVFYLQLADGHEFSGYLDENFDRDGLRRGNMTRDDVINSRLQLARKALAMLVQHFFAEVVKSDRVEIGTIFRRDPILIDAVMWFFRPNSADISRNSRPDDRHQRDVITSFIRRFYHNVWGWVRDSGPESYNWERTDQDLYYHLLELRPQLLRLMDECGELDLLLHNDFAPDEACLAVLREQVFSAAYEFGDGKKRPPANLDEALWAGSKIAPLLILLERKHAEADRQARFRQVAEQRRELEQQEAALLGDSTIPEVD